LDAFQLLRVVEFTFFHLAVHRASLTVGLAKIGSVGVFLSSIQVRGVKVLDIAWLLVVLMELLFLAVEFLVLMTSLTFLFFQPLLTSPKLTFTVFNFFFLLFPHFLHLRQFIIHLPVLKSGLLSQPSLFLDLSLDLILLLHA